MNSKFALTINIDDARLHPLGKASLLMLNSIFPEIYYNFVVSNPSFSDESRANVSPQFGRCDFLALFSVEVSDELPRWKSASVFFESTIDPEQQLEKYRYDNIILANKDLSIITAWAQSEYAVIAIRKDLIGEYQKWLTSMRSIDALYDVL